MNNYIFKTTATMKEYNAKQWWIDRGIVREKHITAETLNAALDIYREQVESHDYITISKTAIKSKQPMYIDTPNGNAKQIGYVITGKTDFEYSRDDIKHYGKSSAQYIDLWVTILTVVNTDFERINSND